MNTAVAYGETTLPAGIRSRFVANGNGITMHVLEAGFEKRSGRALLLVHGYPELAYSWRKVMAPLAAAGYHVIGAADGASALQNARELPRGPDVLVTDIVMPGMSGNEVAESLTRLFPSLRTIFTSGYSEESALAPGSLGPRTAFLPKPYTLSSLSRAVQDILEPSSPAPKSSS